MGINAGSMGTVSYFGTNKPGPGVLPIRTGPIPAEAKKPFGVKTGIDWMTGKHIQLGNPDDGSEPTVALSELRDTDLKGDESAPADGDLLVYDATLEKWKNLAVPRTELADGAYSPVEVEYSTSTGVLRYRIRDFTVSSGFMVLGDFGIWTTIDTAEGCP